jgi:hypothetical protein
MLASFTAFEDSTKRIEDRFARRATHTSTIGAEHFIFPRNTDEFTGYVAATPAIFDWMC